MEVAIWEPRPRRASGTATRPSGTPEGPKNLAVSHQSLEVGDDFYYSENLVHPAVPHTRKHQFCGTAWAWVHRWAQRFPARKPEIPRHVCEARPTTPQQISAFTTARYRERAANHVTADCRQFQEAACSSKNSRRKSCTCCRSCCECGWLVRQINCIFWFCPIISHYDDETGAAVRNASRPLPAMLLPGIAFSSEGTYLTST